MKGSPRRMKKNLWNKIDLLDSQFFSTQKPIFFIILGLPSITSQLKFLPIRLSPKRKFLLIYNILKPIYIIFSGKTISNPEKRPERQLLMNPPAPSPRPKQRDSSSASGASGAPALNRTLSPGMMRKSAQNPPAPGLKTLRSFILTKHYYYNLLNLSKYSKFNF